jgi:two-component system nitrogen regulation sensor histidine kinase NtrY
MDSKDRRKRLPLGRSRRRLSFERQLMLWLVGMGLPVVGLTWIVLHRRVDGVVILISLVALGLGWMLVVATVMESIVRPLQTLANVVAALREDDYSFRARGGRRNDAMGDLALEVNALATLLQAQRTGALEAAALLERVMESMQSPVLAFDPEGRLRLLNVAGERMLGMRGRSARGMTAEALKLEYLLEARADELISGGEALAAGRWVVKRTSFRLRGVPHTLLVLSEVSAALRDEERLAWERLIRVLGHEINNSLTPIKSIAASLRMQMVRRGDADRDFERGLEVIENRADSLNRFLQAYRELMGLPAPKLAEVWVSTLLERVARLETRVAVGVAGGEDERLCVDADQVQQALINLVRNGAEAAMHRAAVEHGVVPAVEMTWRREGARVAIVVRDNGLGLTNESNIFVPFYTTKPAGTGIGLVLAKQIAEAHRGTLGLRNRADGESGCEADLVLPVEIG